MKRFLKGTNIQFQMNSKKVIRGDVLFFVSILVAGIVALIFDVNPNHQNVFGLPSNMEVNYEELKILDSNVTLVYNDTTNPSESGNNLTAIQLVQPENNKTN